MLLGGGGGQKPERAEKKEICLPQGHSPGFLVRITSRAAANVRC